MKKSLYILILYLLCFGYFSNVYTSYYFNRDSNLVFSLLWGIFGWMYFEPSKIRQKQAVTIVAALMFCFFISPLIPLAEYNQSYVSTLIAQRFNYIILILLVLNRLQPSIEEVFKPMRICAFITLFYYVISVVSPSFFLTPEVLEEKMLSRLSTDSTDIGFMVAGTQLTILYTYYKLALLVGKYTWKDLVEVMLLMAFMILIQNRSSLIGIFPLVTFVLYMMFKNKKGTSIMVVLMVMIVSGSFIYGLFQSLLTETQMQIDDDSYDRWLSLKFFGVTMKDSIVKVLFGNGSWAANSAYVRIITNMGTHYQISDVGLVGTYFYYGVIPVIIFYSYALKTMLNRQMPYFLRFYSLWILIVPTIHTFLLMNVGMNLIYMLYFYLILHYRKMIKQGRL